MRMRTFVEMFGLGYAFWVIAALALVIFGLWISEFTALAAALGVSLFVDVFWIVQLKYLPVR